MTGTSAWLKKAAFSADLKGANRMFQEKSLTIRMPLVGEGDQKVYRWLALLAAFRAWLFLVHRLAYNGDVAAGQLAVFQGASEAPISGSIRAERATRKNSQPAAARRVALKMGRRLRCSSVTYRLRYAPSSRLAGGPF